MEKEIREPAEEKKVKRVGPGERQTLRSSRNPTYGIDMQQWFVQVIR